MRQSKHKLRYMIGALVTVLAVVIIAMIGMRTRLFEGSRSLGAGRAPTHVRFNQLAIRPDQGSVNEAASDVGGSARLRFPRVIHADAHAVVSSEMAAAMHTVAAGSGLPHEYFSESSARVYLREQYGLEVARAFDTIVAVPVRSAFFALAYLAREGGIWVAPHVVAVGSLRQLVNYDDDTFVYVSDSSGQVDGSMVAAIPKHPIVVRAFKYCLKGVLARDPEFAVRPFLGLTQAVKTNSKFASRVHPREKGAQGKFDTVSSVLILGYAMHGEDVETMHAVRSLARVLRGESPRYFKDFHGAALNQRCPFNMRVNDMLSADESSGHVVALVDADPLVVRRAPAPATSRIPRIAFQTNKDLTVPYFVRRAMNTITDLNPTFEMRFFTDQWQTEYLKQHARPEVLAAYEALVPHAFKSDLFRYVYMEREGGCYFDSDFVAITSIEPMLDETTDFISAEDNGIQILYNAFMCASPGHPAIRRALNMSVERITKRYYDLSALSITGPVLLGDAFDQVYGVPPREWVSPVPSARILSYRRDDICGAGYVRDRAGVDYFATAFPEYRLEMKRLSSQKPYWDYAHTYTAYVDGRTWWDNEK